ncbi:MAG: hypothetical protein BWX86_02976 [Verrucomicrobia bacterium ADurb.Bin122]|nr:MAG: hypothetical protein BWX86_02976 [Verrucomicrobia bacterium ADurb.Bin122]
MNVWLVAESTPRMRAWCVNRACLFGAPSWGRPLIRSIWRPGRSGYCATSRIAGRPTSLCEPARSAWRPRRSRRGSAVGNCCPNRARGPGRNRCFASSGSSRAPSPRPSPSFWGSCIPTTGLVSKRRMRRCSPPVSQRASNTAAIRAAGRSAILVQKSNSGANPRASRLRSPARCRTSPNACAPRPPPARRRNVWRSPCKAPNSASGTGRSAPARWSSTRAGTACSAMNAPIRHAPARGTPSSPRRTCPAFAPHSPSMPPHAAPFSRSNCACTTRTARGCGR